MSDTRTAPAAAKVWASATERRLYADAQVRVLGQTDVNGGILVEFLSGPLRDERRWMKPGELMRDGDGEGA